MSAVFTPIRVSEHMSIVYMEMPHEDSGNVILVKGKRPTLIDCGSRKAVPVLRQNILAEGYDLCDIQQIILTHDDIDHTESLECFQAANPNIVVAIHSADWEGMCSGSSIQNAAYVYNKPVEHVPWIRNLVLLEDGNVLQAGDIELEIVHTPGHTEGSICLFSREEGVLVAGDTVGGSMRDPDEPGIDIQLWLRAFRTWKSSLKRLCELEFNQIVNGHHDGLISREKFIQAVPYFGKMLNPWFNLV